MSRVIKFRFWDTKTYTMYPSFTLSQIFSDVQVNESLITMQFTGLLDKQGKEVYEGDITDFAGKRCEIRYYDKLAAFGFYFPDDNTWLHFWECDEGILRIEIIGNIYEHPTLVTK